MVRIPCSAIAILRCRLWDIEIIIRRTLAYGVMATLALVYLSSIVLLQRCEQRGDHRNDVDRRFYRRKYDAEKIAAAFSTGLREQVDIEQLSERLLAVVEKSLQPESLSLWLKPAGAGHIPTE